MFRLLNLICVFLPEKLLKENFSFLMNFFVNFFLFTVNSPGNVELWKQKAIDEAKEHHHDD